MFKLTVTCKGAKVLIGEFLAWHQLEQLVSTQFDNGLWEWFDKLMMNVRLFDLSSYHYVTTASNGATVVYSVEDQ